MEYEELCHAEKGAVKNMIGELAVSVLWNPEVREANGDTMWHHIRVVKDYDRVTVIIKKVR